MTDPLSGTPWDEPKRARGWVLVLAVSIMIAAASFGTAIEASCRQALVLALDISGSVDESEYRLQRRGLAAALNSEEVRTVLLEDSRYPVRIAVFEWSSPDNQRTISPWLEIEDNGAVDQLIERIETAQRSPANPSTAIGQAMRRGEALLASQPCWQLTLDISGDGVSNTGPRPQDIDLNADITVNALVIKTARPIIGRRIHKDMGELESYFEANVIRGDLSFIEIANGFEDYERAMKRKLLRELTSLTLGSVDLTHSE